TVTVHDNSTTAPTNLSTSVTNSVTILPVNDPPTLDAIPPLFVVKNSGLRTRTLTGISPGAYNEWDQTISVKGELLANAGLLANFAVNYTYPSSNVVLAYTPAPNVSSGVVLGRVTVTDSLGLSFSRSFTITIEPANTLPTISL